MHAAAEEALDDRDVALVLGGHHRQRVAGGVHATGPADAVNVVLGGARHIEIDDMGDVVDVDPARGDIGGHQDLGPAALEMGERALALNLAAVAVDHGYVVTARVELTRQPVSPALGACEDDHAPVFCPVQDLVEQVDLEMARHGVESLFDAGRGS